MKSHRLAALCLVSACAAALSPSVLAQTPVQKPPAGRSGLDPASRTRIDAEDTLATVDRKLVTGPSGSSCATNIGAPKVSEGDSGIGNRFGTSNNDQVIVVQGPVINLCK